MAIAFSCIVHEFSVMCTLGESECMMVLAGIERMFFIASDTRLCFEIVLEAVLITQRRFH